MRCHQSHLSSKVPAADADDNKKNGQGQNISSKGACWHMIKNVFGNADYVTKNLTNYFDNFLAHTTKCVVFLYDSLNCLYRRICGHNIACVKLLSYLLPAKALKKFSEHDPWFFKGVKYINRNHENDSQERVPWLQRGDAVGEHTSNAGNLWDSFLAAR